VNIIRSIKQIHVHVTFCIYRCYQFNRRYQQ